MAEKIPTLNPTGKKGGNIDQACYETVREVLLAIFTEHGEITIPKLMETAAARLEERRFDGSPGWYTTAVLLDLEARGVIERVPGSIPQRLRIK